MAICMTDTNYGIDIHGKEETEENMYLEKFDNDPQAKEKGKINVYFWDKDPHISQKSTQPCQVYQN